MDGSKFTTRSVEAINAAHATAVSQGNPQVEPTHVLAALMRGDTSIAASLVTKAGADAGELAHRAETAVRALPAAAGSTVSSPATSPALTRVLAKALDLMSEFGDDYIATEHLVLALLLVESPAATLMRDAGLTEASLRDAVNAFRGNRKVTSPEAEATYESLEKYAVDLTAKAEEGLLDPVIGRDNEIRRVVQVLSRRTKNNPVLIGEPGVGKTAVVEGLAQRIVDGDVPDSLKGRRLLSLDLAAMVAGANAETTCIVKLTPGNTTLT